MTTSFRINIADLKFMLDQIKIAEAHAAGTPLLQAIQTAFGVTASEAALLPFGLRTVDGSLNNLLPGQSHFGAADTLFPRLTDPDFMNDADGDALALGPPGSGAPTITNNNYGLPGSVADADPRIISNLIVDITAANPAAVEAALRHAGLSGSDLTTARNLIVNAWSNIAATNTSAYLAGLAEAAALAARQAETAEQALAAAADNAAQATLAAYNVAVAENAPQLAQDARSAVQAMVSALGSVGNVITPADVLAVTAAVTAATSSAAAALDVYNALQADPNADPADLAAALAASNAAALLVTQVLALQSSLDSSTPNLDAPEFSDAAAALAAAVANAASGASLTTQLAASQAIADNAVNNPATGTAALLAAANAAVVQDTADRDNAVTASNTADAQVVTAQTAFGAAQTTVAAAQAGYATALAANLPFAQTLGAYNTALLQNLGLTTTAASQAVADLLASLGPADSAIDAAGDLAAADAAIAAAQAASNGAANAVTALQGGPNVSLADLNAAQAVAADALALLTQLQSLRVNLAADIATGDAVLDTADFDTASAAGASAGAVAAAAGTLVPQLQASQAVADAANAPTAAILATAAGVLGTANTALNVAVTNLNDAQTAANAAQSLELAAIADLAASTAAQTAAAGAHTDAQAILAAYDAALALNVSGASNTAQSEASDLVTSLGAVGSVIDAADLLAATDAVNAATAAAAAASDAAGLLLTALGAGHPDVAAAQAFAASSIALANSLASLRSALQSSSPLLDPSEFAAAQAALAQADVARDAANDADVLIENSQDDASDAAAASAILLSTANAELAAAITAHNNAVAASNTADAASDAARPAFEALLTQNGIEYDALGSLVIPNVSADVGLSPSFNSWMTFFGQFFDHGLDLVVKGNAGTVYVPLQPDDPLISGADGILGTADDLPEHLRFMALTRATQTLVNGVPQHTNTTTSWIDQNQTYTSHASHQVFLREYVKIDVDGAGPGGIKVVSTGKLLDGTPASGSLQGAVANWGEVKAQAKEMLGLILNDFDVHNVPLLATDPYGRFIPGPNGYAQVVMPPDATHAANWLLEGTAAGLVIPANALRSGHAFLDDIAHHAAPKTVDHDQDPTTPKIRQVADADIDANGNGIYDDGDTLTDVNGDGVISTADFFAPDRNADGSLNELTYDDEMLNSHFATGDGRGNENIALTAVHSVFHSEHNRTVQANKLTILASGDAAFLNEWLLLDVPADLTPAQVQALDPASLIWDGERMFQAARFSTEMQYQHLVFEEFARRIQPAVDPFVFNPSANIDPSILAEFAHTVYRFGHSMLTGTVDRLTNDLTTVNGDADQSTLLAAFLNPQMYTASGLSVEEVNASLARGLSRDVGSEIDEFIVQDVRSNLLGLPLDLAVLNIARGRETGIPSLNETRQQLYDAGALDLVPYTGWSDFAQNIKNPLSIVNFIAAYGNHASLSAPGLTTAQLRDAATLLAFGDGNNADGVTIRGVTYSNADRLAFMQGTGAYAGDNGGLDNVDLWIGGLAERKSEFGGMLGQTFNFIFEYQMEQLQAGDRFYYLSRTQGTNLLNQLEPNTFSDLVMRNTDLSDKYATHLSGALFITPDYIFELDRGIAQEDYNGTEAGLDPTWDEPLLGDKVVRDYTGSTIVDGTHDFGAYFRFQGGEHVVVGGTEGDDEIRTDIGDDTLWGDGGNDYLNGGTGADDVFGGEGDDIIEDPFGDDVLRGQQGNDVIAAARGVDLVFGGEGVDALMLGQDASEAFGGEGDDFILGGSGSDVLQGNEGDDWIEGAAGFDGVTGDNSELFFNSPIIGHDVLFGQGDETDYDAESGDDIMGSGVSVFRYEGMFGFDWAIGKGDYRVSGIDFDAGIRIFTTDPAEILRDRFDLVEGFSGWAFNDRIAGDDRGSPSLEPETTFADHLLTQEGINRISGFNVWFGGNADGTMDGTDARITLFGAINQPGAPPVSTYRDGNIILGGDGDDLLTGRGGFDIIDGDAYLNVRIKIVHNGVVYSAESLNTDQTVAGPYAGKVFNTNPDGSPNFASVAFGGASLTSLLRDGTINPGSMSIVREILDGTAGATETDVDTAVFRGNFAEYEIEGSIDFNGDGDFNDENEFGSAAFNTLARDVNGDGFISVRDRDDGTVGALVDGVVLNSRGVLVDDTDLLRNIERLQFADRIVSIGGPNAAPVLAVPIADRASPEDSAFSFTLPAGTFTDSDVGDVLFLTARLADGSALPAWITFNAVTRTFAGTPPANFDAQIDVRVTARDAFGGLTVSDTFTLDITPVNDAPVVATPLADQSSPEDAAVSFVLPAGAFADVDTAALTLSTSALPAWLSFDPATRAFTGTPPLNFNGAIPVTVTASDGEFSVSDTFTLSITLGNDAPVLAVPLVDQSAPEDTAVSFVLPAGTFTDVDTAVLTLSTSALPAWLSFDPATRAFTGTPPANFTGTVAVTVTASDGEFSVSDTFTLDITPVNDAPVVATPLADQSSPEDAAVSFVLPAGAFADVDTAALTLSTSALPAWLSFDPATRAFTGTPPLNFNGAIPVTVTASDGEFSVSDTFTLSITLGNDAPVLAVPLVDQSAPEDTAVSFVLPAGTFTDVDTAVLTLSTSALPAWLSFDPATRAFTGTPPANFTGTVAVTVTASDGEFSVSDTFTLDITPVNDAPVVATPLADQSSPEDAAVSFVLPAGAFADVDTAALTLSTSALPAWLSFDPATRAFTGTPPLNFNGAIPVTVTASDGEFSVSDTFTLSITLGNDAPVLAVPLVDQSAPEDTAVSFVLPAGTFTDVDTAVLTLSTSALPAWLSFDPATRAFTGTPPANFTGTVAVTVTASDGEFSVSDTFTLDITPVNDAPVVATPLADQSSPEDAAVSFVLPAGAFADVDTAALTLSTSALPAWLSFDPATRAFTGTPPLNFNGAIPVTVTASDGEFSVSDTFTLSITLGNDAPVLAVPLVDQSAPEDTAVSFVLPAGTFTDVDTAVLTLSTSALPAWLSFDPATRAFTGTPPANFTGTVAVTVTASDGEFSVSDTFTLDITPVNDAPVVATPLADQSSPEDAAVSFVLPASAFADVDTAALTLSTSALPAWLSFDPATRAFTGTPPLNFNGAIPVTVTASDGEFSVSDTFTLSITLGNDAPVLAVPLVDQSAPEDTAVSFVLPAGTFTDVDTAVLTLSTSALPAWLSFDPATRAFTGTPPANFTGTVAVTVTASDGEFSVSDTFTLDITPVNDAPVVATPLADQSSPEDAAVSFVLPAGAFADVDTAALTLSTSALPAWLSFDPATRAFTGTPPVNFNGAIPVTVTASDGEFSVSDTFTLSITLGNDAPVLAVPLVDQSAPEDTAVSFVLPEGTFTDVDTAVLTLSTSALPAWLSFDPATRAFTGTPPANFTGTVAVTVTASDGEFSVSDTFTLDITPVNDAPVVATPLADQSSPEDAAVSFVLPAGAFADVDTAALTLSTSALPAWLSFDPATRAFTGTPPVNFNGAIPVTVTASDGEFSVSDTFTLSITPVEPPPSNLLINGSFELPGVTPGGFAEVTSVPGWTALTGGQIEIWNAHRGIVATDGTHTLELDSGGARDGFFQDVTTVAGQVYTLTFDLQTRPGFAASTQSVEVVWNGVVVGTAVPGAAWGTFTVNVTGTGGANRLTIQEVAGQASDGIGAMLDNFRLVAAGPPVPSVSVSATPAAVTEGAASAAVTFTLSAVQAVDTAVTYSTVNGTALAGSDFTGATAATAVIPAGSTSITIQIPILNDAVFEPSEAFSVRLDGAVSGATVLAATGSATITITDNDPVPATVSIAAVAPGSVVEGASAGVVFTLSSVQATDVTVTYSTANGTASAPGDYTAAANATVIIPAGQTSVTVGIATINDTVFEPTETFSVNLVGATQGAVALAASGSATITITDNDVPPPVTNLLVNGSFELPGVAAGGFAKFTSVPGWTALTGGEIEVWNNHRGIVATNGTHTLELDSGGARDGFFQDVTTVAGQVYTLTFDLQTRPGFAASTQSVEVVWNGVVVGTAVPGAAWGTFTVNVTGTGGANRLTIQEVAGQASDGIGAMLDNFRLVAAGPPVPSVSVSATPAAVTEGAASAAVTFTLSAVQAVDTAVTYSTVNGTALAGSDFTGATAATAVIPAGSTSITVQIPILNDAVFEPSEAFSVRLDGAVSGATVLAATGSATITITDNDVPPPVTNLLVNGSFELPGVAAGGFGAFTSVPGWTALTGGEIEVWNAHRGIVATNGTHTLELDSGGARDGFFQDVTTVAGQVYTLTFDLQTRPGFAASTQSVEVVWNGVVVGTAVPGAAWGTFTVNVTGTGGANRLTIQEVAGQGGDGIGAMLDNFRLVATGSAAEAQVGKAFVNESVAVAESTVEVVSKPVVFDVSGLPSEVTPDGKLPISEVQPLELFGALETSKPIIFEVAGPTAAGFPEVRADQFDFGQLLATPLLQNDPVPVHLFQFGQADLPGSFDLAGSGIGVEVLGLPAAAIPADPAPHRIDLPEGW